MAKIIDIDQHQGNTIRIAGTYGYMSYEYAMHGHYSGKSDVFSFGVIIIEIISAKRNSLRLDSPDFCWGKLELIEDEDAENKRAGNNPLGQSPASSSSRSSFSPSSPSSFVPSFYESS
ncbi:hypothetical protein P8452_43231 [Trifolium repens]|nr:hypothetical protein P8452_43231 [Trifolium repens]